MAPKWTQAEIETLRADTISGLPRKVTLRKMPHRTYFALTEKCRELHLLKSRDGVVEKHALLAALWIDPAISSIELVARTGYADIRSAASVARRDLKLGPRPKRRPVRYARKSAAGKFVREAAE